MTVRKLSGLPKKPSEPPIKWKILRILRSRDHRTGGGHFLRLVARPTYQGTPVDSNNEIHFIYHVRENPEEPHGVEYIFSRAETKDGGSLDPVRDSLFSKTFEEHFGPEALAKHLSEGLRTNVHDLRTHRIFNPRRTRRR